MPPSPQSASPPPTESSLASAVPDAPAGLGPPDVVLILSGPPSPLNSAGPRPGPEERADAATVARAEARGELVRLRAGVHVARREWEAVSARERHLLRIRALARVSDRPPVVGSASAAAVHGLPRIAAWPGLVTLLDVPGLAPGRRAGTRIVRDPAGGRSALAHVGGGVRAPGLAATALAASHEAAVGAVRDAASRAPGWFAHGLVALDHALAPRRASPVTRAVLDAERALRGPGPWSRRAALLVEAADGAAVGPAESIARGVAEEAGLQRPEVGVRVDGHGRLALAWPGRGSGSGSGSSVGRRDRLRGRVPGRPPSRRPASAGGT